MGKRSQSKRIRRLTTDAEQRRTVPGPPETPAEIALWWLTGGHVPPEFCFLAGGEFCIWSPERSDLLICAIFDGDWKQHEATRLFLEQSGAAFESIEAVKMEARRRGLPGAQEA